VQFGGARGTGEQITGHAGVAVLRAFLLRSPLGLRPCAACGGRPPGPSRAPPGSTLAAFGRAPLHGPIPESQKQTSPAATAGCAMGVRVGQAILGATVHVGTQGHVVVQNFCVKTVKMAQQQWQWCYIHVKVLQ